ncbi:MAG TPA: ABC transporter permease [Candidatus Acidoferrum sp.]
MADTLIQDVRLAVRVLLHNRSFALVAIAALGLGIGANATIYSTLRAMVLRPLPFRELDRVLIIGETVPRIGWEGNVAPANYRDLAQRSSAFERLAAFQGRGWDANVTGAGMPERLEGYLVTPSFFSLLGMAPLIGRVFSEGEAGSGSVREAIISYATWQNHFGADPQIIGRNLSLNGGQVTVIAVMPREFDFPIGAEIWAPWPVDSAELNSRGDHTLDVIGRLKSGVSVDQARAELNTIAANLEQEYPATNEGRRFDMAFLRKQVLGDTRQYILILMWSAVFVLLLACANVANLQLARTMGQQKELAVRIALGASRLRIVSQVLAESAMLSLAGGVVGLVLAEWAVPITRAGVPPFIVQHIAGIKNIKVDGSVLAFTAIIAVLTGILAGVVPALQACSTSGLSDQLKEGLRGSSFAPVRGRSRSLLVLTEVALAMILLVGACLMVKGFRYLANRYPGYEASGALTFRVTLPEKDYATAQARAEFYQRTVAKLASVPGVQAAAGVQYLPSGWFWQTGTFSVEDMPSRPGEQFRAGMQTATPDFFRALRIPLRSGRFLTHQDGLNTAPVAVITETMANRYWPHRDPIGHRIRFGSTDTDPWRSIVGVVGDIRQNTFDDRFRSTVYTPMFQAPPQSSGFILRTSIDPMSLATAARGAVQSVDRNLPTFDIRTLQQLNSDNASGVQYSAQMMFAFALIALLLAVAGIYAVMAYAVVQRTHELGVRLALGARPADVLRMVIGNSVKLAAAGLAVGVPVAFVLMRVLASLLVGVVRLDIPVLAGLTGLLALAAALAGYLPARRAARIDPIAALRNE